MKNRLRLELIRETPHERVEKLNQPEKVFELFSKLINSDREEFWTVLLDSKNRLIGTHLVSVGTLNASLIHPREVFKAAIVANAHRIIIVHNHPSGDPTPSKEDREVTNRLELGGVLLGITVLDSIIIGDSCFHSIKHGNT